MKNLLIALILFWISCAKESNVEKRVVTGQVKDSKGQPLAGVKILIDHSIFYNSNMSTLTDQDGRYSIDIRTGSWYAFAIYEKMYNNKKYQLDLHPDNSAGFGGEGAVRNFEWKLTGEKPSPLVGYYGGLVTIDHFPGYYIESKNIEFSFIPDGALIDGSEGNTLLRKATDGHQILDIPIGRYRVEAKYNGQPLKLRRWNSDDAFQGQLLINFEPRIDGQCDNCYKIEYNN